MPYSSSSREANSSSLESTGHSNNPQPAEASNLDQLGEQLRQGLKTDIHNSLSLRIESQLQANGILQMFRAWGVQSFGNERALIRQKADEVLKSIDLLDEKNLYDLQDLATKLQEKQNQPWHDLDKVIKRSIWPQPPLG